MKQELRPNEKAYLSVLLKNKDQLNSMTREAIAHEAGYTDHGATSRIIKSLVRKRYVLLLNQPRFNIRIKE